MKHVFVKGKKSYSFLLPEETEMGSESVSGGPGRVEIAGVPFELSKWTVGPPDPEYRTPNWHASHWAYGFTQMGDLSRYVTEVSCVVDRITFWDTVTILKSPMSVQVLEGMVIPIQSLSLHPAELPRMSTTNFLGQGFSHLMNPSYMPLLTYPDGESVRWIGNDPHVLGLLQAAMMDEVDGRSSRPPIDALADYWEERGDSRGTMLRECKNYGEVCFFLKFGVTWTQAGEAIKAWMEKVGRAISDAAQVMSHSFLQLADLIRESGQHFANLHGVDDEHCKPDRTNRRNRKSVQGNRRNVRPKD